MKIFIINYIGENEINKISILENLLNKFNLDLKNTQIGCIKGFFGELSDDDFLNILPLLNGYFGKYYFYESVETKIKEELIFGKNIFDFEYDEKIILNSSNKLEKIKEELSGNNLITNSKKEEFKKTITDSIYNIGGFLVKTFFLIEETLENKSVLEKLINDKNSLEEYKAQATLMNEIAFNKFELIKARFDTINLELEMYTEILNKYFKNFIK